MSKIALIPGDGAGIEVVAQAKRVLEKVAPGHELVSFDFGAERYLKTGVGLPPGQLDVFKND